MVAVSDRAGRIDGYDTGPAHWLRSAMGARPQGGGYVCAVIRLAADTTDDVLDELTSLRPLVHITDAEQDRLRRIALWDQLAGATVFVYLRASDMDEAIAALQSGGLAMIEQILPGSAMSDPDAATRDTAQSVEPLDYSAAIGRIDYVRAPVLGIIDDEIGYLNARFARVQPDGTLRSRVQGVWVQHIPHAGAVSMDSGPIVGPAQISAMMEDVEAGRTSEAQAYRRFLPPDADMARGGFASVTHGTHVLDLAAGFDPKDAPDIPIFAVDLPAQAVEAPGARRGASYLVQGIRWLIHASLAHIEAMNAAALAQDDGRSAVTCYVPDLVLTCSIGSYAGPRDGTGLFARLVGEELDLINAQRTPHELGSGFNYRATLFQSFGNAFAGNQSAYHRSVQRAGPIDWVLPRGDAQASLLEIRITGGGLQKLWMRLGGTDLEIKPMKPHQYRQISHEGQPIARVYREADEVGGRQLYSVLIRPTIALNDAEFVTAPAGPVRLVVDMDATADVVWQVERDDVPFGYSGGGKQSVLSDPLCNDWSSASRDYSAPAAQSAILREGSELAQAHSPHPAIVTVGAALADDPGYAPVPSGYSAAGSLDPAISQRLGPDVSATGDDRGALWGVLATGTQSGSIARLAGTSVAAPQAARRMLLTGEMPVNHSPLSVRTAARFEDRSGARDARTA